MEGTNNNSRLVRSDPDLFEAVVIEFAVSVDEAQFTIIHDSGVQAIGYADDWTAYPPVAGGTAASPVLTVRSPAPRGLKRVALRAPYKTDILLYGVCIPGEPEITRHITEELSRWSQQGEVLEAHKEYRLALTTRAEAVGEGELAGYGRDETFTDFAYFRTGAPPGCSTGHINVPPSDVEGRATGLEDLAHYIRQTMPATVGPSNERLPPRGVYRAYDLGVDFNENYTDLMYRQARRDLQLHLYDNNGPARDSTGRIIVLDNQWAEIETVTRSERDERWLVRVTNGECIPTVVVEVRGDTRLVSVARGQLLAGATPYEARLVPLLLHDDFGQLAAGSSASGSDATLGRWQVHDLDEPPSPSHWMIAQASDDSSQFVCQNTAATTLLVCGSENAQIPADWMSYCVSGWVRVPDTGETALAFRCRDATNFYAYVLRHDPLSVDMRRELVSFVDGQEQVPLAKDRAVMPSGADCQIIVEAIGPRLRIYQRFSQTEQPQLVFDVIDSTHKRGAPALYCTNNPRARFGDIRVNDFRDGAPVAFHFNVVTSRFVDFFHHLHSFQDETWVAHLPIEIDLTPLLAAGAMPSHPVSDDETRAHDALLRHVPGAGAAPSTSAVEATRLEQSGTTLGFLIHSPEPLQWDRVELALSAARQLLVSTVPQRLKLTGVTFGISNPNEESVALLVREATNLSHHAIQWRPIGAPDTGWQTYFTFGDEVPLSAGTQVRVFGGRADQAALPRPPRAEWRFGAPADGQGVLRFTPEGVELRVLSAGLGVAHSRGFVPSSDFVPLSDIRVLRKADGTSFFVFSASEALTRGTLRLALSYRRDNRINDPGSPVLSVIGDISAEHVEVQIPW